MEKNNGDRFEVNNPNIFETADNTGGNFFMNEAPLRSFFQNQFEPVRRLNDYDFNLLEEEAYKDVKDELFKLEYKISRTEEELKDFDSQIQAAREIRDFNLAENLMYKKRMLEADYKLLLEMYSEKSLSARISGSISGVFGSKLKFGFKNIKKNLSELTGSVLSKMPEKFSSIPELKKSLEKLENINKSVDELVSMNIPYGENIDKYEKLSKYIIKANSIQINIARYLKK